MRSRTETHRAIQEVEQRVAAAASGAAAPLVLAVSGGLDSMVLLDTAARVAPDRIATVATFDHGSGVHSAHSAAFVCSEARARGLPAVSERSVNLAPTEALWRKARWGFLRSTAARHGAFVATAHTEDDQIETVLMRAMRGAGARGLASLYAASDVCRPFIDVSRATLERYARARGVRWVEDPTNEDRRFFRNRVRRDLLPALMRVRPSFGAELLSLAREAAGLRAEIDGVAATISSLDAEVEGASASLSVAVADVAGYDAEALAVLWPAIAARVGLALDWRGTRRLVAFTNAEGRVGASMQLSGGWEVVHERHRLTLRRTRGAAPAATGLPRAGELRWGRWSFVRDKSGDRVDPWHAMLPSGRPLIVRAWQPGDRMIGRAGGARRVKRFFSDAGIVGPNRAGWPVVLAGEEIVWIPGVTHCTSSAAPAETPGLVYSCELNYR
jgi:tRNA(Ile)-lysidine synthase